MGRSTKIVPEIRPSKPLKLLEKTGVKPQSHLYSGALCRLSVAAQGFHKDLQIKDFTKTRVPEYDALLPRVGPERSLIQVDVFVRAVEIHPEVKTGRQSSNLFSLPDSGRGEFSYFN